MKSILGSRIRERRRTLKITQSKLANHLGISASYLNLIEHNKRNIAGGLLVKVAEQLNLNLDELDGAQERRLLAELESIANIPSVAQINLKTKNAGEIIGRYPDWSKAIAALAKSEQKAIETARSLADRLTHDLFLKESIHNMLSSTASIRSAIEILIEHKNIDSQQRRQFEQIINTECEKLTRSGEALAAYFDRDDESEKVLTPTDEVELMFKLNQNRFESIENAVENWFESPDSTRQVDFNEAILIAKSEFTELIGHFIGQQPQIETELAYSRAVKELISYTARALCLPIKIFEQKAIEKKFDLEALSDYFSLPIELIYERFTSLPKSNRLPSFGYYLANASGTIISMRSIPGLNNPRYASACPLWVLYRAQQTPGEMIRQRAIFPSGDRFVFLARARLHGSVGFAKPKHFVTDMLVMYEDEAANTIYAVDGFTPLEKIGSSCRSCPRQTCQQRVIDPLTG